MNSKFTDFNIEPGAYVAFDATSLKKLIIQRLQDQGVFTDQVYEGSNLSSMIDVISYSFHTLMFYLNRTSSESMFTESQLYENMNRIVKLLNYKPVGFQTSVVSYTATMSSDLPVGTYTIPRYTMVDVDGIPYVLANDVTFAKPTPDVVDITSSSAQFLLYQGEYVEYPQYSAVGEDFEVVILSIDPSQVDIDHFNIDVYVQNEDGTITQFEETTSLYMEGPGASKFEKRLNENKRYELKFGNDVNGQRLKSTDTVMVYYISSSGTTGQISASALNDKSLILYTTPQFNLIKSVIKTDDITYLDFDTIKHISLNNTLPSTEPRTHETVDQIRNFAPQQFLSQERLITAKDFTLFAKRNFGNVINDALAVSNDDYINGHLKYLTDEIGVTNPMTESRVLYNQANFSTTTNFNNVYMYCVPRTSRKSSLNIQNNFLPPAQKEALINSMSGSKALGLDVTFADPVYMAVDFGISANNESLTPEISNTTGLQIVKSTNIIRNSDSIREETYNAILDYFNNNNITLGQEIDVSGLLSSLLSISGVDSIRTHRRDTDTSVSGISLMIWNPVYDDIDINIYNQNVQLPYYKFPYFFNDQTLLSRIDVVER